MQPHIHRLRQEYWRNCFKHIYVSFASLGENAGESARFSPSGEVETKLILTAAGFLGKQLES